VRAMRLSSVIFFSFSSAIVTIHLRWEVGREIDDGREV
jgi:hypothetical protein